MKKCIYLFLFFQASIFGQVGIGTTSPSINSILDLNSSTQGFLMPRLTTEQRNDLGVVLLSANDSLNKGMQVFDTTINAVLVWDGSSWKILQDKNLFNSNGDVSPVASTNREISFSNGGSLNIDSNSFFIDATTNRVGVNTNTPSFNLDVNGSMKISNTPIISTATRYLVKDPSTGQVSEQSRLSTNKIVYVRLNPISIPNSTMTKLINFEPPSTNTSGSDWNSSLGTFTCSRPGVYLFQFSLTTALSSWPVSREFTASVQLNGTGVIAGSNFTQATFTGFYTSGQVTVPLNLAIGDVVSFWAFQNSGTAKTTHISAFNGLTITEL